MILPRAWPTGRPPLSDCSCSRSRETLCATASSCIHCLVWRGGFSGSGGTLDIWQWGQGSVSAAVCWARRSAWMLISLTGRFRSAMASTWAALPPIWLSPLVTTQRSVNSGLALVLLKMATSSWRMSLPWPAASSWRALHWMAMGWPSERRIATASMPRSRRLESGKWISRSGQSAQCQHWAMSHSLMWGAAATVMSSSQAPSVCWGFFAARVARAAVMMGSPVSGCTGGAGLLYSVKVPGRIDYSRRGAVCQPGASRRDG